MAQLLQVRAQRWTDDYYVTEAEALGLEAIWCINYTDVV